MMKKILQTIFSVTNENNHKIIKILGLKIKLNNYEKKITILKNRNTEIENILLEYEFNYEPYHPHSIDVWGSFKKYALLNNMPEKIKKLKSNLDEKSKQIVDNFLWKSMIMPEETLCRNQIFKKNYIESLYSEEEKKLRKKYINELNQYKKDFYIGDAEYCVETFCCHNGLIFCNQKMKTYIEEKDFIDGGAFVGDSALIFERYYNPKCVYSFEISKISCENLKMILSKNNRPLEKFKIINKGISHTKESVCFDDSASPGTSILYKGSEPVELTDIDSFADENKLDIGFIKLDIEGQVVNGLKGMENTIKKHRPILNLAIYHTPDEFFEAKPILEEITKELNYKIEVKHLHYSPYVMIEYILFAYPAELSED